MARDTDGIIQIKFAGTGDVGLGDLVITEGWPIIYSTPGGTFPQRVQFNQLLRFLFALAVEINQDGPFLDYNNTINYNPNAGVVGSDNIRYRCLIANGPASSVVNPVGDVSGRWTKDDLLDKDAFILSGQTGYSFRPKGQLAFLSDEADPTSHAILTGHILNAGDEGALEFLVKYSDASSIQISADFARTISTGSGTGDKATARSIRGTHVNSTSKGDTTPLVLWDGNSAGVCLGATAGLPWEDIPIDDDSFVIGEAGNQLQVLTTTTPGEIVLQAFDTPGVVFKPLSINALSTTFGVGDVLPSADDTIELGSAALKWLRVWANEVNAETIQMSGNILPTTTNTRTIGSNALRFFRLWCNDIQAQTIGLNGVVTYQSGTGSPEGVVSAAIGSIYTNDAGGAGQTLWVKETAPTGSTGWVAK